MPPRVKGIVALALFIVCFGFALSMKPNKVDPNDATSVSATVSAPVAPPEPVTSAPTTP